ncbi:CBU_0592 family membrane protein [Fulvivirga lutea]
MTFIDWVGAFGVFLILLAYLLHSLNRIHSDGSVYLFLNLFGAGLACVASIMLNYWPFIILESAWVLVSIYNLVKTFRQG